MRKKYCTLIQCILLMVCLSGAVGTAVRGQEYGKYQLKIAFGNIQNSGNGLCKAHFKVYSNKTGNETILKQWEVGDIPKNGYTDPPASITNTYSIQPNTKPEVIGFFAERGWSKLIGGCKYRGDGGDTYKMDYTKPFINVKFMKGDKGDDLFSMFDAPVTILFHPYQIDLWYFDSNGHNQNNLLPMSDDITLKATKGFVTATYNWQYSTDGNNWTNFPSTVRYASNKEEVTFKGTDLFSEAIFKSLVGKTNVLVRIDAVTEKGSNAIVLYPGIELPHITKVDYEPETCNGSADATMLITLDRALNPGERVYVAKGGQIGESDKEFILDATNTARFTGMEAETYQLQLIGALNGYPSYAGDPSHSGSLTIVNRPAITHSITSTKHVSCIDGSDGEITVNAAGGNGDFIARLFENGQSTAIQQSSFLAAGKGVFTRLKKGVYRVEVYDTNGCAAYQSNGNVLSHSVEIKQPLQPVNVTLEHTVLPLAFDSSDGESTIRVNGGTQATNGYTILWRSENGQSYSSQSTSRDGESFLYTFKGLHRGKYYITVEDKNYPSLISGDQVIPCGCSDTLSYYLAAPPLLEVQIEKTHHVHCNGSDEGQLTAHGKGGVPFTSAMPYTYTWYLLSEAQLQEISMPNDSIAENLLAGKYQVKVTDANRISALSAPFTMTQPDSLRIRFEADHIGCSGSLTGKIKAFVTGGTQPYKYQWNREGETKDEITALEAGIYMFKITDVNNCQLTATTEVKAPGDLKVDTLIVQPSCIAPNGGSIALTLSGATPPYKVVWADNQSTGLERKELAPGTYYAAVTDVNGCSSSYSFVLHKPREFSVELGEGFTMCRDQSRTIEAICEEPDLKYEWYYNETKLLDTESKISVNRAGIYRVVATNTQGCSAEDELQVSISQETLDLDFTIPTIVAANSDIHAVNLSTVTADKLQWHFPKQAQVSGQTDTEAIFSIREKGIYTVSMEGVRGDCSTIVTRSFDVVDKDAVELPDDKEPMIKQFLVTPNPSTGYFKVLVELNKEEDFTMLLYSPSGFLMDQKEAKQVQSKTFEYEINGSMQGTYLLHLQTKSDKSVLKIVINRN